MRPQPLVCGRTVWDTRADPPNLAAAEAVGIWDFGFGVNSEDGIGLRSGQREACWTTVNWELERHVVETRLRDICVALPEVHEGLAWNGRGWLIRRNHFCQVFTIDDDETHKGIMIFRSEPPELDALVNTGHPFFKPRWGKRAVGMVLDDDLDWDEVAELITDSYCIQAPKKLAALVSPSRH